LAVLHAARADAGLGADAGVAVVIVVGALTFVSALALGAVVEHLQLHAGR
jgi:K+-transporting ATPase A subunit